MDFEQEKLVYRLYRKGRENLTTSDKLFLEANLGLKKELFKMYDVKEGLYQKCNTHIEAELNMKSKNDNLKIIPFSVSKFLRFLPAAAIVLSLMIFLIILPRFKPQHEPLGGKVSLFITNTASPNHFYRTGSSFHPGEEFQLAFQPPIEIDSIRQGIMFSFKQSMDPQIHYTYDSQTDLLDLKTRIVVEKNLRLTEETEYFHCIIFFSRTSFDEQTLIREITKIIKENGPEGEPILLKKYKSDFLNYIYLRREDD